MAFNSGFKGLIKMGASLRKEGATKMRPKYEFNQKFFFLILNTGKTGIVNIHVRSEILPPQRDMYTFFNPLAPEFYI